MVQLALGLAILTSGKEASIAWAQRLWNIADRSGLGFDRWAFLDCIEACDQVRRKYGEDPTLDRWEARSLALLGKYEAAKRFSLALPYREEKALEAQVKASEVYQKLIGPGLKPVVVAPLDGPGQGWLGVSGKYDVWEEDGKILLGSYDSTFVHEFHTGSHPWKRTIKAKDLPEEYMRGAVIRRTKLDSKTPIWIVAIWSPGADNSHHQYALISKNGHVDKSFTGEGDSHWGRTADGRAYLNMTKTWKIWWPDVYEWDGRQFIFANRRHPEEYFERRPRKGNWDWYSYPCFLRVAAVEAMKGNRKQALADLTTAERLCKMAIKHGQSPNDEFYYRYRTVFWGDDADTLAEIRQRIRWIKAGDMNHDLLYRPYDWDLQVPPYHLGKNKREEE